MRVRVAIRPQDGRRPAHDCGPRRQPWGIAQRLLFLLTIPLLLTARTAFAAEPVQIKIRDLATVEGVRENPLIGYGMIVGLNGTGDKQQTVFAIQTLAGILQYALWDVERDYTMWHTEPDRAIALTLLDS